MESKMILEVTDRVYIDPSQVSAVIGGSFGVTTLIMRCGTKVVVDRELLNTVNLINEYKKEKQNVVC
jgi:hypothetical protein